MSSKKRKVTLTERQWDHVLIAVENARGTNAQYVNDAVKNGWSKTGSTRILNRFNDIIDEIVDQLDWDESVPASSTWKIVLDAASRAHSERAESGQNND